MTHRAPVLFAAVLTTAAWGQPADPKPATKLEFEVASIKPAAPPVNGMIMMGSRGGPGRGDPGRISYSNLSIKQLVVTAYGVKRNQVSGGPDWLDSERFDITAKVPEGASKEDVNVMLQNLLAERFKLTIHRETKEMPIYALIVGKGGPKLKESSVPETPPPAPGNGNTAAAPPPPLPPGPPRLGSDGCPTLPESNDRPRNIMMMSQFGACMVSTGQTMSALADQLANQFDRPVVDMTGLKGRYDYKLNYDPSSAPGRGGMPMMMMAGPGPGGPGPSGPGGGEGRGPAAEREPAPSIFAAIQEQLGLKLDARRAPVDLLVVDSVQKTPTEN